MVTAREKKSPFDVHFINSVQWHLSIGSFSYEAIFVMPITLLSYNPGQKCRECRDYCISKIQHEVPPPPPPNAMLSCCCVYVQSELFKWLSTLLVGGKAGAS